MTKKSGLQSDRSHHTDEFSRRAESYTQHNIIQKRVVRKLLSKISSKPKTILDLGCGSGAVYDLVDWPIERFVGIDRADQMCRLHPQKPHIELLLADFEDTNLLQTLGHFDMVVSSSALQWATNLERLFERIAAITDEIAFAIFCDGTFKTIYDMTQKEPFLPSSRHLRQLLQEHFSCEYTRSHYKLHFEDNISKFRYIKQSGVSGGSKQLSVQQTRSLIRNYPHDYLEFEVLFVWGKTLR